MISDDGPNERDLKSPPEGDGIENNEAILLTVVVEKLDYLTDLFARRLFDDREKRQVLIELQRQIATSSASIADAMRPNLLDAIRIIDRLQRYLGPDPDTIESIINELLELLSRNGVEPIAAFVGETIRLEHHEILSVLGEASGIHLLIHSIERNGYVGGGLQRPTLVRASAHTDEEIKSKK